MAPDRYFILIYDIPSRALQVEEFGPAYDRAADRYSELEDQHRSDDAIEVVLVGAESLDVIRKTHSHYFAEREDDLFSEFLETAG